MAHHDSWGNSIFVPIKKLMTHPGALQLLAFFFLFKLGDALAGVLIRPFLIDMGYSAFDRGLALAIAALGVGILGTMAGVKLVSLLGLRQVLILSCGIQTFSNLGYYVVSLIEPQRTVMFTAIAIENFCGGLGAAALQTLVLRTISPQSSSTQYAFISVLLMVSAVMVGPLAGWGVHRLGWSHFFIGSMIASIPGFILVFKLDKRCFS